MNLLAPVAIVAALFLPLGAQEVLAGLYRPSAPVLVQKYAPAHLDERTPLWPVLHLYGRGFRAGKGSLEYRLLAGKRELKRDRLEVEAPGEVFERSLELKEAFPGADRVAWTLQMGGGSWKGVAPLSWSRFSGRLDYVDGRLRPSYVSLHPYTFGGCEFLVPVGEDGRFEAQVPARVYAVANVNGAGYAVDAMERWAWDFDLTKDREEVFRVGRTEIYGMHAFCLNAPTTTVFVTFRPTALTRFLQHVADPAAQPKDQATMAVTMEHLRLDPMAIAPDLKREAVKVWLDGAPQAVSDLSRVVETNCQGINQTLYILQFTPKTRPARGVRHEVKLEVQSRDVLQGKLVEDFGQGSVGLYLE